RGEEVWAKVCALAGLDDGNVLHAARTHTRPYMEEKPAGVQVEGPEPQEEEVGSGTPELKVALVDTSSPQPSWMTGVRRLEAAQGHRLKRGEPRSMQLLPPGPVLAGPLPAAWFAALAQQKRLGVQTGLAAVGLWWAYLRSGYADAFGVRQESLLTCGVEPL